jgi:hypothetical protein
LAAIAAINGKLNVYTPSVPNPHCGANAVPHTEDSSKNRTSKVLDQEAEVQKQIQFCLKEDLGQGREFVGNADSAESVGFHISDATASLHLSQALQASFCTGRSDTLFPNLTYLQRRLLRIDAVAAFSVTDQNTASKMSAVLRQVAILIFGEEAQVTNEEKGAAICPPDSLDLNKQSMNRVHQKALSGSPGRTDLSCPASLLGLTVTDGTACCGGNTLSLLATFSRVNAVELDEDRWQDLCHNLRVLGHCPRQHGLDKVLGAATAKRKDDLVSSSSYTARPGNNGVGPENNVPDASSSTTPLPKFNLKGRNMQSDALLGGSNRLNVSYLF